MQKKYITKTDIKEYTAYVFFLQSYSSRSYIKFLIYFEFVFVYAIKKAVQHDSFACGCTVFSTPFIERAVFSLLYILASFDKD